VEVPFTRSGRATMNKTLRMSRTVSGRARLGREQKSFMHLGYLAISGSISPTKIHFATRPYLRDRRKAGWRCRSRGGEGPR